MKRISSWLLGLGIAIGILGFSTFVSAAPEQISGVATTCVEQGEKTVCTFAIKPWGPDFKGVYGYTVDTLGKGVDWKTDPRVQVYSTRTGKAYAKTDETMLGLQTGDLVIITKSKPAPKAIIKVAEPAAPADKIVVFKSGDVPHALALEELGDASAWSLAGVRFLHPARDEEFAKTDEATRRYPVGTRMVIAHELLSSRSKGSVGVESKTPAGDRKIVAIAPVMPPARVAQKATQAKPPTTYKAAFVLPIPKMEPTKPAAENPPPSVPQSIMLGRQGAERLRHNAAMLNEQAEADRREEVSLSKAGYAIWAILFSILAGFPFLLLYRRGSGNVPPQREEQEGCPARIAGLLVRYWVIVAGLYERLSERIKDWMGPATLHEDPPDPREMWAHFVKPEYLGSERRSQEALDVFRRKLYKSLRSFFSSVDQVEVSLAAEGQLIAVITFSLAFVEEMLKDSLNGALAQFFKGDGAQINGQRFAPRDIQFGVSPGGQRVATVVFETAGSSVAV